LPLGALLICVYLFLNPLVQLYAYYFNIDLLNFGAPLWKNFIIYGLAAPFVGYLLWIKHERARFAIYIFLTLEITRAIKGRHFDLLALSTAIIVYLQTGEARRIYPSLKPTEVTGRMKRTFTRFLYIMGKAK